MAGTRPRCGPVSPFLPPFTGSGGWGSRSGRRASGGWWRGRTSRHPGNKSDRMTTSGGVGAYGFRWRPLGAGLKGLPLVGLPAARPDGLTEAVRASLCARPPRPHPASAGAGSSPPLPRHTCRAARAGCSSAERGGGGIPLAAFVPLPPWLPSGPPRGVYREDPQLGEVQCGQLGSNLALCCCR